MMMQWPTHNKIPAARQRRRLLTITALSCLSLLIMSQPLPDAVGAEPVADTNARYRTTEHFKKALARASEFRIAVLPMENIVVQDPLVSDVFRSRVMEQLRAKGYTLVNKQRIDKALQALGLSHAGQLSRLNFDQLGSITAAHAFLSGVVEESGQDQKVVANSYVYTCSLKLQDRHGNLLWSGLQERVAKLRIALDPFNAILDAILISQGGDQELAIKAVADRLLSQFPPGPAQVITGDPLLDQAITVDALPAH